MNPFTIFLQFITGGGVNGIAKEIRQYHTDRLKAETDKDKLAIDLEIEHLRQRQNALTRGSGAWISKLIQALWAAPFILYNFKVVFYDKVLGLGVTDKLGSFEQNIGMIIVGFYFLTTGAVYTINKIRN